MSDGILDYLDGWEQDVLGIYETDTVVFSINFTTLMTVDEFDYYIENYDTFDYSWFEGGDEIEGPEGLRPGGDCTCRYSIWCGLFITCEDGLNACTPAWNCGLVGDSECTGQCDDGGAPTN